MRQPGKQMRNDSPKMPYKMQNPEIRSSRNLNFGNNMEALQNAKHFFNETMFFCTKCMAQEDFGVQFFGQNLLCTKPGLTYLVEEIQTRCAIYIYTVIYIGIYRSSSRFVA